MNRVMKQKYYIKVLMELMRRSSSEDINALGRGVIPEEDVVKWISNLKPEDYVMLAFIHYLIMNNFYSNAYTNEELEAMEKAKSASNN